MEQRVLDCDAFLVRYSTVLQMSLSFGRREDSDEGKRDENSGAIYDAPRLLDASKCYC